MHSLVSDNFSSDRTKIVTKETTVMIKRRRRRWRGARNFLCNNPKNSRCTRDRYRNTETSNACVIRLSWIQSLYARYHAFLNSQILQENVPKYVQLSYLVSISCSFWTYSLFHLLTPVTKKRPQHQKFPPGPLHRQGTSWSTSGLPSRSGREAEFFTSYGRGCLKGLWGGKDTSDQRETMPLHYRAGIEKENNIKCQWSSCWYLYP